MTLAAAGGARTRRHATETGRARHVVPMFSRRKRRWVVSSLSLSLCLLLGCVHSVNVLVAVCALHLKAEG